MNKQIKVVSLFSGIGGFEEGLKKANIDSKIVFASEIDSFAQKSYIANFGNENLHGDIKKVDEKDVPDHNLLLAGFPCQSFSIAGLKQGFNDTRGTLFFDVARILKKKQPKYILLENVKNLVGHNDGETFRTIINTLNEVGYTVDFTIINSVEAGLPQNRERTYIVGILNGESTEVVRDIRNKKIDDLKATFDYKGFDFFNSLEFKNEQKYIKDIITEEKGKKYLITNDYVSRFLIEHNFEENGLCAKKIIKLFDLPRDVWNDLERQRRVYSVYGISPTILARSDTTKVFIYKGGDSCIRKFTPKENFRLQGFDDEFIENIINNPSTSMTQQYKQAGNAVSPPVITVIMDHFVKYMEE